MPASPSGRAQRRVCFQRARGVQQPRARFGQAPRVLAGAQHLGQISAAASTDSPSPRSSRQTPRASPRHSRRFRCRWGTCPTRRPRPAPSARQLPVHSSPPAWSGAMSFTCSLAVQNGRIQVRDAPALGNVEGKNSAVRSLRGPGGHLVLRQVRRGLPAGCPPRQGQVAVHHGRDARPPAARGARRRFPARCGPDPRMLLNARPYIVQM